MNALKIASDAALLLFSLKNILILNLEVIESAGVCLRKREGEWL